MKHFTLLALLFVATTAFSQKDGKYLADDDPVNNLWEYVGDNHEDSAPLMGMGQQFFFLIGGGSENSLMAPFEMEGMGFACPTKFIASSDAKYIYVDIVGEPCEVDLPENERYFKVAYSINTAGTVLTLIVDGKKYDYKPWE